MAKIESCKCGPLDVIEVQIKAPHAIRIIDRNRDERNAEAVVNMAIMRRGVEDHFFTTVPAGKYRDGDHFDQRK